MLASAVAISLVHIKRAYIPLKCKNIPLLYTLFATMLIWYIGDIWVYQPTVVAQASRSACIFTMSWMRMSFGIYSVLSCHIFRVYQYYCIFEWRVKVEKRLLWIPIILWACFPLVYGILASALSVNKGISYITDPPMCYSAKLLYFIAVGILVLLLICWIIAIFMISHIHGSFNEFYELLAVIICTVVIVVLQVVLRWIPRIGDSGFGYNTMVSMTDVMIGQLSLFILISRPLYHSIKDPFAYQKYFLHKLKRENHQSEYEIANGTQLGRISTSVQDNQDVGLVLNIESPTEWTQSVSNELLKPQYLANSNSPLQRYPTEADGRILV
ncbi:hypothetical protein IWW36_002024 [Coemansia brasiliensis]|uniref:Uncharacterized protein n=1 Tax=Coemansia brasiliensis TaxID=2650707 RepID=A0A9W8IAJ5_9FUNG|nr:hypothetical protein IWW36_002024 [Coemansia brasiliensis]